MAQITHSTFKTNLAEEIVDALLFALAEHAGMPNGLTYNHIFEYIPPEDLTIAFTHAEEVVDEAIQNFSGEAIPGSAERIDTFHQALRLVRSISVVDGQVVYGEPEPDAWEEYMDERLASAKENGEDCLTCTHESCILYRYARSKAQ